MSEDRDEKGLEVDPGIEGGTRRKKVLVNKHRNRMITWSVAAVQFVLSLVMLIKIMNLDVLPMKFLVPIGIGLVLLIAVTACSVFCRKTVIAGWIFGALMIIVLDIGSVYLIRTEVVLEEVTVAEEEEVYKIDNIVVAVLQDDTAQTMEDTLLYNFGIQKTLDRENTDIVIGEIEAKSGIAITVTEYEDFSDMIRELRSQKIQAIIYNTAFNDTISETEKDFTDEIRTLDSHSIHTKVLLSASDVNVSKEPFTVYISGIDVYGDINQTSRSDVNILVTVNPVTKQILMTTIPRDYWVPFPDVTNGVRDKLTHAGLYGIQCSMDTLSWIYGVEIDYYARVNFDTLKKVVNALGGVDVYSEYEFTTHYKNGGYEIKQGYNHMNGKVALAFARERYNVPGGDEQRGRDQQAVLKAIIEKAMSPSILTGYMGILESISGSFETNMRRNQIANLVKMQLADGAKWDIEMQSVTGTTGPERCYSTGWQRLSVMHQDDNSIYKARLNMLEVGATALDEQDPLYRVFEITDPELLGIQESETETESESGSESQETDLSQASGSQETDLTQASGSGKLR